MGRLALLAALTFASGALAADDACTPSPAGRTMAVVTFAPPEGGLVAGLTMIVDYPERKVSLPGTATSIPKDAIGGTPTGAVVGVNDSETEVKIVLAAPGEIRPGSVVELGFQSCEGSERAAGDDFTCRVVDAADPMANAIRDVTCRVTMR